MTFPLSPLAKIHSVLVNIRLVTLSKRGPRTRCLKKGANQVNLRVNQSTQCELKLQVRQGTSSISGFREDRRNTCKGVYPLNYGAYSSHGPTYDSTFANLTKEETELVYNTYSDTVGVQYAESILNFSR